MTRLRLIPVVIFAAASLLLIKAMTIFSGGDRLSRPLTVVATEPPRATHTSDNAPDYTSAMPAKETKKEEPKNGPQDPPPGPPKAPETPPGIHVGVPGDPSPAQRALLERLQQRREELDAKTRDLELRENLLKEAEQRLEAKLNELKMLEAAGNEKPADTEAKMKNLVVMYEGMKPKDAARIFDKLDMKVLVEVARAMKPAKLADVLAVMSVEPAQRLTIELARGLSPDRATPPGDLQRVNVPPPAPKQQPKQQNTNPPPAR